MQKTSAIYQAQFKGSSKQGKIPLEGLWCSSCFTFLLSLIKLLCHVHCKNLFTLVILAAFSPLNVLCCFTSDSACIVASLVAQTVENLPIMLETWVQSLGWKDPLEKGKATHSSIFAWRIPWTEEPGELQSMGSQRVGHS